MPTHSRPMNDEQLSFYENLERARENATASRQYSSIKTRQTITEALIKISGQPPYDWQLDVAEAALVGLDATVISGTGSGKTISFILPLLADETGRKMVVIISPLKELQKDQVSNLALKTCRASFTRARSPGSKKWDYRPSRLAETLGLHSYPRYVCAPASLRMPC